MAAGLQMMVPVGKSGATCWANMASTWGSSRAPSAIIFFAPQSAASSSAGWNTSLTLPAKLSRMSMRTWAAPSSMAAWVSWPQACITPGVCDAKGRPVSSLMGRASMSARRPTHLGLLVVAAAVVAAVGAVPSITAVTPYPPTFSLGSRPMSRSRAAIYAAVSFSSWLSSGCACMCFRYSSIFPVYCCTSAATRSFLILQTPLPYSFMHEAYFGFRD